jgi:UDP-N-acetylglucosamine 2-epimerase
MVDALYEAKSRAPAAAYVLARLGLGPGPYVLVTVHRAANTDDPARLHAIFEGLAGAIRCVFAVHPRTAAAMSRHGIEPPENVAAVEPLGYTDTMALASDALAVVTDSGGLQKEAYLLGTPCVTLRDETEWTDTVALGWNVVVGSDPVAIRRAIAAPPRGRERPPVYGDGRAAARIVDAIEQRLG